ncbi:MAG: CHASE domain-containing protein [Nitrosopumilus sp.]|nr:CHASE domain-containing protein [Nitrosopumilus sp.]
MLPSKTTWIVFGISITTTLIVWVGFLNYANQIQEAEFNSQSKTMTQDILNRLDQYEQLLNGARGFLSSKQDITPQDWKNFIDLQIISRYSDVQGIGFTKHVVGEEQLNNLVTQMISYGVEDFSITPEGKRNEYYPVIFMEPLDSRNKRAIGYDTYFEDSRKEAVNLSINSGKATLSGKIILVQETEKDVQNGFLLMMPVFSTGISPDNEKDSSSVLGMINAVFRINDFIDGLLGKEKFEYIHLRIYDGSINPESLFFDSNEIFEFEHKRIDFTVKETLEVANRNWILVFDGTSPPLNPVEGFVLTIIPIVGFSLSGLLFYVFYLANKNLQLAKNSIKSKKMENIGKLAAALAHDLRNPLSVVSGAMYLLSNRSESLDEKSRNLISKSNSAVERMKHQINDVMNYVQTGKLEKSEVSFKELINIPGVIPEIPSNITLNLPQNDLWLYCDKRKIEVLMGNMILNSIEAISDKTGTITIRIMEEQNNVIIEVQDSGPGVPKENMKKIFEPLFTSKPKGTGLGLASCEHIVNAHNGKIVVTNNPTTFRIIIPKK